MTSGSSLVFQSNNHVVPRVFEKNYPEAFATVSISTGKEGGKLTSLGKMETKVHSIQRILSVSWFFSN